MAIAMSTLRITERSGGKVLEVDVTGKLERQDYEEFIPEVERRIEQHGSLRLLFYVYDFSGWTPSGLWQGIQELKHFGDVDRVAVVGEARWQEALAAFCRPFTAAQIRYFQHDKLPEARQWVEVE